MVAGAGFEPATLGYASTENGKVQMPIQKTFWAARFGMLVDRFGIPWMINCEGAAESSLKGRLPAEAP
jgi:PhnB protein